MVTRPKSRFPPRFSGGAKDESVPVAAVRQHLTGTAVDVDTFCEWLGPKLAEYRFWLAARRDESSRSEHAATLRRMETTMSDAMDALRPDALHPEIECLVNDALYRLGGQQIHEVRAQLWQGVMRWRVLLEHARAGVEGQPERTGAKSKERRDALLREVVAKLRNEGLKAEDARGRAAEILVACRVQTPGSEDSLPKAIRRGAKTASGGG